MIHRSAFPARFRRRIAIAFVAVAGISAGALALGAALTVYSYRTRTFDERAREQVRDDVRLLAAGASPQVVAGRLADAEEPGGPGVIVVTDGAVVSSVGSLDLGNLPRDLRDRVRSDPGALHEGGTELRTGSALVIGTVDIESGAEAYFFFPREELDRSIRELLVTLGVGWLVVISVAAVAGTVIARRTLRPVRTAADAARSVAEGILDTRLPVRSGDEFGEWAASFNEMVSALEQKIAALAEARDREQRFAADIAHDLRTPIAAVLTAASHLAEHASSPPERVEEIAHIVAASARRLDRLTSELLELHRLEAGQEVLHIEDVDLVVATRYAVAAHGWTDHATIRAPESVVVATDRRRLDRIIVNLIANALQHGGTTVQLAVAQGEGGAWVSITDDGPGIAPDDLLHIFDRHFKTSDHRAVEADGASAGSGLGLSIAWESAQLLGGRLDVASSPGRGTTFTLWLRDTVDGLREVPG